MIAVGEEERLVKLSGVLHLEKLQEMYDIGITNIGNLDLKTLIDEAKGLEVFLNKGEPITIESKERMSAKYFGKTVIINHNIIFSRIPGGFGIQR
jgi:hypothetical protein